MTLIKFLQFRYLVFISAGSNNFIRSPLLLPIAHYSTDNSAGRLTHFDGRGHAHMVDVGSKVPSRREARASGVISLSPQAFDLVIGQAPPSKGDVLGVARIAGILATKHTSILIPLCHTLSLTHVGVEFDLHKETASIGVRVCVKCEGVTGVEMEALTAVSVTLLTIYDMTKAAGKDHVISDITLDKKLGGKSGDYTRT